jgi:hypothetical protein
MKSVKEGEYGRGTSYTCANMEHQKLSHFKSEKRKEEE